MNIIKKIFGMIAIIVVSVVMFFPTDKVSALTKISLNKQNKEMITSNFGDWFTIETPKSGTVQIVGDTELDWLEVSIYNAEENFVKEFDPSSGSTITGINEFNYEEELLAGVYYIQMKTGHNDSGLVDFTVNFKNANESFPESQNDTNDDVSSADSISLNKEYIGHLAQNDYEDYYKFVLSEDCTVLIKGESLMSPVVYRVYNSDGKKIEVFEMHNVTSKKENKFESKISLKKGTYYLSVDRDTVWKEWEKKGKYTIGIYTDKVRIDKTENLSAGIRLTWSYDGISKEYNIYKKTGNNSFEKIAKVSNTTFTDSDVKNGEVYSYKIAPVNSSDSSNYSDTKKIKRLSGVTITSIKRNGSEIEVKFTENKKADGYKIYYCTDDSFEASKTKSIKTTKLSGKITGLKKDKTYYIRVRAYSASGDTSYNGVYTSKKKVTSKNGTKKYVTMKNVSKVTASSKLKSTSSFTYGADNLIDNSLQNAWCEGVSGYGEGESVTLTLDGSYIVSKMKINAGYQKSSTSYYNNSRPKKIKVSFSNGKSLTYTLADAMETQTVDFGSEIKTKYVKIEILSVYKGNKYKDTLISEIKLA